jgi:hypothetical protein
VVTMPAKGIVLKYLYLAVIGCLTRYFSADSKMICPLHQ